jgi:hypothetical protein
MASVQTCILHGGAGVLKLCLLAAVAAGMAAASDPEIAFGISLDRPVYEAAPTAELTARIVFRNTHPDPVKLTFPTSQLFELQIHDASGHPVWRWSEGRVFVQMITRKEIAGEHQWVVRAPLAPKATPWPPGRYVAEGWLTTTGGRVYSASVGFEVR